MVSEQIKYEVECLVSMKQGIKAMELACDPEVLKILGDESFHDVIEELITEKRIVEVEYVVPSIPYRLKSFYLPADSIVIRIRGQISNVESTV